MTSFVAGVFSGLSVDLFLHPLDNLKCLYQTRGSFVQLRELLSFRALYRGFPAVVVGAAPVNGLFYFNYENGKKFLREGLQNCDGTAPDADGADGDSGEDSRATPVGSRESESRRHTYPAFFTPDDFVHLGASAGASVVGSAIYCPIEVVKETAMVHMCSTREAIARVQAERGIPGFFRGLLLSNATWVPYLSGYFLVYERLKISWYPPARSAVTSSFPGDTSCDTVGSIAPAAATPQPSFLADLGMGLVAGAVSASLTYPVDAWKTRVQSGMTKAAVGASAQASARGLLLRVMWLAPASGLTIAFFEQYSQMFKPLLGDT